MGCQPIWDCEYDLGIAPDEAFSVLEEVFKHKMMVVGWVTNGPAGGNPMITLRGTRRQHVGWLRGFYDPSAEIIKNKALDDDAAWHEYRKILKFKFVA